MRNLKRALSLALASVMLLGMMVVGSSAAGYADVASEHNAEAIEVLQAVGVMTGDQNGNFNPDATLTRNEMAVVMCNLMDYVVSSYHGAVTFSDVPAWAADYVSACATNGIVSGIGDGKYGGDLPVTTGQAGLMLMKALGYFQYGGDFGQDWLVATTKKGNEIGLFDDVDNGATAALTRNQAAQMVLNALQADMVSPDGNGNITISPDGTITSNATYDARTSTNSKYGKIDDERSVNNGRYLVQLGEDLFNGDLEKITNKTDDFGRPGTKWEYKGSGVGTYADGADNSMIINKELSYAEVMTTDDDYFSYDAEDISKNVKVYVNGDKAAAPGAAFFKAGDVVEVYEEDDVVVNICVTRYTLAKIDGVEDDLSSTLEKKGASVAIDLVDLDSGLFADGNLADTYYDNHDDSEKVLNGFAASTYTEGTVLAVAVKGDGSILASHVATPIDGTVTRYNSGSKATVTVGGTAYALTTKAKPAGNPFTYDDESYTVYVNSDNYVIGYEANGSASLDDVYYVTGVVKDTTGLYNTNSYYAQAVKLADGTVEEIRMEKVSFLALAGYVKSSDSTDANFYHLNASAGIAYYLQNDGTFSTTDTASTGIKYEQVTESSALSAIGANTLVATGAGLYTFTDKDGSKDADAKSNNNKFWAEVYNHAADSDYYVWAGTGISSDLKRDASSLTVTGGSGDGKARNYLNANTQYVKIEKPGDDIDVTTATGGTSATTGTVNGVAVVSTKSGSNQTAAYVVLISNSSFGSAAADADILYVDERSSTRIDTDKWEVTAYLMDGSGEQTITADIAGANNTFYTYTINDDGVYELDPTTNAHLAYNVAAGAAVKYDDETGLVQGIKLSGVYNDTLSGSKTNAISTSHTFTIEDVDFDADVVIIDSRDKADRDADIYDNTITSKNQLKNAIEKDSVDSLVYADIYLDDGKVILVSVTSVKDASAGPGPGPGPGSNDAVPGNVENLELTTGVVESIETDDNGDPNEFAGISSHLQDGLTYSFNEATKVLTVSGKINLAYPKTSSVDVPGFGVISDYFNGGSLKANHVAFIPIPVGDSWLLMIVGNGPVVPKPIAEDYNGLGNAAFTIRWDLDWSTYGGIQNS